MRSITPFHDDVSRLMLTFKLELNFEEHLSTPKSVCMYTCTYYVIMYQCMYLPMTNGSLNITKAKAAKNRCVVSLENYRIGI